MELPMTSLPGTLLVVDDDEANRDMLSRRLERKGFAVTVAEDGSRAIELVRERPFDLVLLDVLMPGLSGLDVLRELRLEFPATELPVIMATALPESVDVVEALRLGANDYVSKPLDFPVVLARIQAQLALKRAVEDVVQLERDLEQRNHELIGANARLAEVNRRMERDLRAAARIQETFLPRGELDFPGARFAWHYRPCEELAGDGLNVFGLDDRHAALYVFDVSGHGVASALLSVSLSRVLSPPSEPSSVLRPEAITDGVAAPGGCILSPAEVAGAVEPDVPLRRGDRAVLHDDLRRPGRDVGSVPLRLGRASRGGAPPGGRRGAGSSRPAASRSAWRMCPTRSRCWRWPRAIASTCTPTASPRRWTPTARSSAATGCSGILERARGVPLDQAVASLLEGVRGWSGSAGLRDDVSLVAVEFLGP